MGYFCALIQELRAKRVTSFEEADKLVSRFFPRDENAPQQV
jgi:hypothetical protein